MGTWCSTVDFGGVVLLFGFGFLGWLMKSLGWSRAALLLSFILGPLIEKFYFHSVMMYDYAWLLRPAVIIVLLCAVAIIYMGLTIQKKAKMAGGN
jgi:TctA family transporter